MELGDGPPTKRFREFNRNEFRFLIPARAAGVIIGKGGANVKRLREQYQTRITIPDSSGHERVLVLECAAETAESIIAEIGNLLISEVTGSSYQRDPSEYGLSNDGSDWDVRLLLHQSLVGCIIGKGGTKIKELREGSQLKQLKVYQTVCPSSTDRVVQMIGGIDDVITAFRNVLIMIGDNMPRGPVNSYDGRAYEEGLHETYGGWGPAGSVPSTAGNQQMTPRGGGYSNYHGRGAPTFMGPPMMRPQRAPMIHQFGNQQQGPIGGQQVTGYPQQSFSGVGTTSQQVSIPDQLAGSIIGPGGSRIKQVRMDSGADIKIDKGGRGEERIITIHGTQDQIQNAQFLLQMCVKKYSGQY